MAFGKMQSNAEMRSVATKSRFSPRSKISRTFPLATLRMALSVPIRSGECSPAVMCRKVPASETRLDPARAQHAPAARGLDDADEAGNCEHHREPLDTIAVGDECSGEQNEGHDSAGNAA